jgi:hypothetical protein
MRLELAQAISRSTQESLAKVVCDVPEGNLSRIDCRLLSPNAFLIQSPVNAQSQFNQKIEVPNPRRHIAAFEFQNVPCGQMMQKSTEWCGALVDPPNEHDVRRTRCITDGHIRFYFVMLLNDGPKHLGEEWMPLHERPTSMIEQELARVEQRPQQVL